MRVPIPPRCSVMRCVDDRWRGNGAGRARQPRRRSPMRALTWHGIEDVRISEVPDPHIEEPTDAVVRVTSTAICGSDLHLYRVLAPYLHKGDVLGHEFMGIVEEVGPGVA